MAEQLTMYIDGAWVDARSGDRFDTTDPATGAVLASLPRANADDVALAVAAARRTFDDGTWGSAVAERERARILFRMAELVRDQQQELAELEVRDCGKPIGDALVRHRRGRVHVRVLRRVGDEDRRRHPAGRAPTR